MHPAIGLLIGYATGSFPTAYLAGRLLAGVDLRKVGSGNLGTTNVYRSLGAPAALLVLVVDVAKGTLPVRLLPSMFHLENLGHDVALWWALAYGVAAILGHTKPVFLLWRGGGKGVATAAGVFAAVVPLAVAETAVLCAAVAWLSGYMSVASVAAAVAFPLIVWINQGLSPVFWVGVGVASLICWSHRANFRRLRAGKESRLFGRNSAGEGKL